MWKLFGIPEVSKTLGFAARNVLRAKIMVRATGYNGRVSMYPLYPTYKNCRSDLRIATTFIPLLTKEGLGEVVDCFEPSSGPTRTALVGWVEPTAKPNAFETSGLPNASRQHRNHQNKKKR